VKGQNDRRIRVLLEVTLEADDEEHGRELMQWVISHNTTVAGYRLLTVDDVGPVEDDEGAG
jgi:hypothetical protein